MNITPLQNLTYFREKNSCNVGRTIDSMVVRHAFSFDRYYLRLTPDTLAFLLSSVRIWQIVKLLSLLYYFKGE